MNAAFRHVLEWFFEENQVPDNEGAAAISKFEIGLQKGDAAAAAELTSVLAKAEKLAADSENDGVLELIDLGKKIVVAESALSKANGLIAIRSIESLPPTNNPITARIRETRLHEHVKSLAD